MMKVKTTTPSKAGKDDNKRIAVRRHTLECNTMLFFSG